MKIAQRFKNRLTGDKVTVTEIENGLVTYQRDQPHKIDNRIIKTHSKPEYVFQQIY